MMQDNALGARPAAYDRRLLFDGDAVSGVSWAAVFAGAAAAAALALILLLLGMGLGFSAVSPWSDDGISAGTFTITTAVWLALTQIVASAVGGYLAGRLRIKWRAIHTDEVYFRDTAHGLLSWAVATLVTAAFLGSAVAGAIGTGVQAAGKAAAGTASAVVQGAATAAARTPGNPMDYLVDSLFRSDGPAPDNMDADRTRKEAATILVRSVSDGEFSPEDKKYLAGLIARQTGLSQADAERRIDTLYQQAQAQAKAAETKVREAADSARKAAAVASLWMFVSLLCGAFFASLAAIWGGRRRDLAVIDEPHAV